MNNDDDIDAVFRNLKRAKLLVVMGVVLNIIALILLGLAIWVHQQ